ncbi:hypothetical protein BJI67_16135 (plasmid) [Acidihalobacter aeolianus]|uniref:Uncharacterized protein n=1 Tax=Acidihalobacter aeolianus TaxID=2792603 RepID=A0A1D8KCT8_9GAMM|nr:hypothetical protein [Acidihalobacter aeolianus]AOV18768.1 hypothetical protein BJI67_16135 [Acidihalobacter aeolianus]
MHIIGHIITFIVIVAFIIAPLWYVWYRVFMKLSGEERGQSLAQFNNADEKAWLRRIFWLKMMK